MILKHIARFIGLCAIAIITAGCASRLPPASIAPSLDNDTNPPTIAKNATGVLGTINRLDPAIDKLLAPDAQVEILVDGVDWAEGPVWFHVGLNFSDVKQSNMGISRGHKSTIHRIRCAKKPDPFAKIHLLAPAGVIAQNVMFSPIYRGTRFFRRRWVEAGRARNREGEDGVFPQRIRCSRS